MPPALVEAYTLNDMYFAFWPCPCMNRLRALLIPVVVKVPVCVVAAPPNVS